MPFGWKYDGKPFTPNLHTHIRSEKQYSQSSCILTPKDHDFSAILTQNIYNIENRHKICEINGFKRNVPENSVRHACELRINWNSHECGKTCLVTKTTETYIINLLPKIRSFSACTLKNDIKPYRTIVSVLFTRIVLLTSIQSPRPAPPAFPCLRVSCWTQGTTIFTA